MTEQDGQSTFEVVPQANNTRSKGRKILPLLIGLITLIFLFYARLVIVLNHDTFFPISGANVETRGYELFFGCAIESKHISLAGLTLLLGREKLNICDVNVTKEGYHPNGRNHSLLINIPPWIDIVTLRKIKSPQKLIVKEIDFYEGSRADFLSGILEKNITKISSLNKELNYPGEIDFDFPEISNEGQGSNVIGRGLAKIRFYGQGGIQQIPRGGEEHRIARPYAIENLVEAPRSGYTKELVIKSGAQYVAKLRDGKHYMKFEVFISKNISGRNHTKLSFFIQPEESNNLESVSSYVGFSKQDETKDDFFDTKKTSNVEFRVLNPKPQDNYYHDEDVLFYGTAEPNSLVEINVDQRLAIWKVKADSKGNWYTGFGDMREQDHFSSIKVSFDQRTVIVTNEKGEREFIDYTVRMDAKPRRENYELFTLEVPAYFVAGKSRNKNDADANFVRGDTDYHWFGFSAVKGSDIDLAFRLSKYVDREKDISASDSNLEKVSFGNFSGYIFPKYGVSGRDIILFLHKGLLIEVSILPNEEQTKQELVNILNSLEIP